MSAIGEVWLVTEYVRGEGHDMLGAFASRGGAMALAEPMCRGMTCRDDADGPMWWNANKSRAITVRRVTVSP